MADGAERTADEREDARRRREREPRPNGSPRAGAAPARQRPARPARARKCGGRFVALLALALAAALAWFLIELFQPFHLAARSCQGDDPDDSSSGGRQAAARDGVIYSSFFFELRATLAGDRGKLRAGHLPPAAGHELQRGAQAADDGAAGGSESTKLTIIDGHNRAQVDALLQRQGVKGNYSR